jgi:hypothetical protein
VLGFGAEIKVFHYKYFATTEWEMSQYLRVNIYKKHNKEASLKKPNSDLPPDRGFDSVQHSFTGSCQTICNFVELGDFRQRAGLDTSFTARDPGSFAKREF